MDIILLCGAPDSGKTTTMNLVYNDLVANGATVVVSKTQLGANRLDFECVLDYKGKLVAIFSMGDYLSECWSAVIQYAYCDKIVLAYNNKFKKDLAAIVGKVPNHTIVNKSAGNAAISNQSDAATILTHI
jgi:hypothetical protein